MTSFIVEYVSEPVTRSFEGGRTHRPWLGTDGSEEQRPGHKRREEPAAGSTTRSRAGD